jgi:hypothetical protein
VVAARLIEAGPAGTSCTGTYCEAAGELRLAGGGERGAFLVTNTDPCNVAAANGIGERIERVADQSEDVLDPDLLECAN